MIMVDACVINMLKEINVMFARQDMAISLIVINVLMDIMDILIVLNVPAIWLVPLIMFVMLQLENAIVNLTLLVIFVMRLMMDGGTLKIQNPVSAKPAQKVLYVIKVLVNVTAMIM
jgi:hypothetical protein